QAMAARQTDLTGSKVQIEIARNQADADLERARKRAEQTIVTAEAESKQRMLAGEGEAKRIAEIGQAEAEVLRRKIESYMDPKLYAVAVLAEHLSKSSQPLVPQQVFTGGGGASGGSDTSGLGLMGTLVNLLIAEKSGFKIQPVAAPAPAKEGNGSAEQLVRAESTPGLTAPKLDAR